MRADSYNTDGSAKIIFKMNPFVHQMKMTAALNKPMDCNMKKQNAHQRFKEHMFSLIRVQKKAQLPLFQLISPNCHFQHILGINTAPHMHTILFSKIAASSDCHFRAMHPNCFFFCTPSSHLLMHKCYYNLNIPQTTQT